LILDGDRDEFCQVEQAVAAYRQLPDGELAILPGHGHYIPPAAIEATIEFLKRRAGTERGDEDRPHHDGESPHA
jgi:pimeloyl-ACP methyl ester carboxylesterase